MIAARANGAPISTEPWGATADHQAVTQVTFTDPEVASVGLTAAAAITAGYDIDIVDYQLGNVADAALHADNYEGMARMIVDKHRSVLLGLTFTGPDVSELLHAATIAITAEIPITASGTPSPPTPPPARSGSASSKPTKPRPTHPPPDQPKPPTHPPIWDDLPHPLRYAHQQTDT